MMKLLILCVVVVVAVWAQRPIEDRWRLLNLLEELQRLLNRISTTPSTGGDDSTIDTIHGWRLEDHTVEDHHLLLFIKDQPASERKCYLIIVSRTWETLLEDYRSITKISEEIYAIVQNPDHAEIHIPSNELADMYEDFEGAQDCRGHSTYQIYYSPSFP